jgi:hypothetical protein
MGVGYNHLWEVKSSKQERDKICMGRGDRIRVTFLYGEQFLHGNFWTTREFRVLKLEGSHGGYVW